MNFAPHARAGLTASAIISVASFICFKNFDRSLLIGLVVFAGSVFPDLDTDSKPSRWTAKVGFIFSFIMLVFNRPYVPAIAGMMFFLIKSSKHRGFIHKYYFPALCFILAGGTGNLLYAAFAVGLVVHFWLDRINPLKWRNWIWSKKTRA